MSKRLENRRILVVDDEPHIPVLLRRFLSGEGAQIYTALNAQEALRLLPSVQPDLVILDDSLPDMNGWQVCHCIQQNPMSRSSTCRLPACPQAHQRTIHARRTVFRNRSISTFSWPGLRQR